MPRKQQPRILASTNHLEGINELNATISLALAFGARAMPSCVSASPGSKAAIEALESRFAAAFSREGCRRDHEVLRRIKACSCSMPGRRVKYARANAYRKDWKDFLATFKGALKPEVSDLDVGVVGPIGYSHSIQHVTGTDTLTSPSISRCASPTCIVKIGSNGSLCRSMFRCRWTSTRESPT